MWDALQTGGGQSGRVLLCFCFTVNTAGPSNVTDMYSQDSRCSVRTTKRGIAGGKDKQLRFEMPNYRFAS